MTKMELFENIRRDFSIHGKSRRQIARERNVHRRTVRQALASPIPPARKAHAREPKVLTNFMRKTVDLWLDQDKNAPRKQRHTAKRIFQRLKDEFDFTGAKSTVRHYVGVRRRELGFGQMAFIPLDHLPGHEAEVDWYEAKVEFPWGLEKVQFFQMRACFSGREFHMAFPNQSQQAFLEGHLKAFAYFGGVFDTVRYDNLSSAVKRVLKGRSRNQTDRFLALRSHYLFQSEFCLVGKEGAHEKGGVEGGVGHFRRNHLVPVPSFKNYDDLNHYLKDCMAKDDQRIIVGKCSPISEDWSEESQKLRQLPAEPFQSHELLNLRLDTKGRISINTNHYSAPITLVGRKVEARVHTHKVEIFHGGKLVGKHDRLHGKYLESLQLDHYLELLQRKPGALERSKPLTQARKKNQWPDIYDSFWRELKERYGAAEGTRQLLGILMLHRSHDQDLVHTAVKLAGEYGSFEARAVKLLLDQLSKSEVTAPPLQDLEGLEKYDRPKGSLNKYDILIGPMKIAQILSPLALLWEALV
jgi:transposase